MRIESDFERQRKIAYTREVVLAMRRVHNSSLPLILDHINQTKKQTDIDLPEDEWNRVKFDVNSQAAINGDRRLYLDEEELFDRFEIDYDTRQTIRREAMTESLSFWQAYIQRPYLSGNHEILGKRQITHIKASIDQMASDDSEAHL